MMFDEIYIQWVAKDWHAKDWHIFTNLFSNFQNLIFRTKKFRENFSPKIDKFPKLWAHTKCVNLWRPIVIEII